MGWSLHRVTSIGQARLATARITLQQQGPPQGDGKVDGFDKLWRDGNHLSFFDHFQWRGRGVIKALVCHAEIYVMSEHSATSPLRVSHGVPLYQPA